uniref:ATP synthase subunit a n=1 Tax=Buthus occitanus TaxID=6868 RepID=B2CKW1_BUTOI|nr:ATP synthase F0 subunit 6 [Buthus occitanus]ACA66069.1 ATP synthase subunit 6 [Buthus occitanus]
MMMNLFVVFDPVSVLGLQLNWMSLFLGLVFLPLGFWVIPSRYVVFLKEISKSLAKEVGFLYSKKWGGVELLLVVLFWFIVFNNFLGLFPFVFTATSHILVTLGLALPIWFSLLIFGWVNKTKEMFAHLVPMGTPFALMNFMVLIETVSNLIRPITLSVRLAANMIAGHLLIVLLGSAVTVKIWSLCFGLFSLSLLFLLESAVAFIQSYVFMILVGLYSAEV